MSRLTLMLVLLLLSACASQASKTQQDESDAVADFITISDLDEVASIRTMNRFHYSHLSERYAVVATHNRHFLVEFYGRCREMQLVETDVQPDIRYDSKAIHVGADTIRGCRIKTMYEIEEAQALELDQIGEAPGEDR